MCKEVNGALRVILSRESKHFIVTALLRFIFSA